MSHMVERYYIHNDVVHQNYKYQFSNFFGTWPTYYFSCSLMLCMTYTMVTSILPHEYSEREDDFGKPVEQIWKVHRWFGMPYTCEYHTLISTNHMNIYSITLVSGSNQSTVSVVRKILVPSQFCSMILS